MQLTNPGLEIVALSCHGTFSPALNARLAAGSMPDSLNSRRVALSLPVGVLLASFEEKYHH